MRYISFSSFIKTKLSLVSFFISLLFFKRFLFREGQTRRESKRTRVIIRDYTKSSSIFLKFILFASHMHHREFLTDLSLALLKQFFLFQLPANILYPHTPFK